MRETSCIFMLCMQMDISACFVISNSLQNSSNTSHAYFLRQQGPTCICTCFRRDLSSYYEAVKNLKIKSSLLLLEIRKAQEMLHELLTEASHSENSQIVMLNVTLIKKWIAIVTRWIFLHIHSHHPNFHLTSLLFLSTFYLPYN